MFCGGTDRNGKTDRQTDIATSRMNRPRADSVKILTIHILQFERNECLFIFIPRLGVAGAVLQTALSTELLSYSYSP